MSDKRFPFVFCQRHNTLTEEFCVQCAAERRRAQRLRSNEMTGADLELALEPEEEARRVQMRIESLERKREGR